MRADARVGVTESRKSRAVQLAPRRWPLRCRWQPAAREHLLPLALRMESAAIKHCPRRRLGTAIGKYVELLFGAPVLPGKAQKLEKKSTALGVERLFLQLVAKRVDGLLQVARTVK